VWAFTVFIIYYYYFIYCVIFLLSMSVGFFFFDFSLSFALLVRNYFSDLEWQKKLLAPCQDDGLVSFLVNSKVFIMWNYSDSYKLVRFFVYSTRVQGDNKCFCFVFLCLFQLCGKVLTIF